MKTHNIVKQIGLACIGLSIGMSAWAEVPVKDIPNDATLLEQTQNTMGQLVQLTQLIKSTTSIASALASGQIPSMDQLEGILGDELLKDYLPTFGLDTQALSGFLGADWDDVKKLAKTGKQLWDDGNHIYKDGRRIYKNGKSTVEQFRSMNGSSAVSLGTRVVKKALFAKDSKDLTSSGLAALKGRRTEAVKEATSSAYALAVTAQQESASAPKEKLSSNSKGSNKADSVVTQIRNNTGALMSIATQLNMGNLLSASNLEVLASSAISSMAASYLSPDSSSSSSGGEDKKKDGGETAPTVSKGDSSKEGSK